MKLYTIFGTRKTPQDQAIPNSNQSRNNAGGFGWQVDDWSRLDRFLVLGSEGGTYYVSAQALTISNAEAVVRCIKSDGIRVVNRTVEISQSGRAPKNDPALFVLAMAAGMGDTETRRKALEALPAVARIGTHLFHFLTYVQQFRGWGRGLREGVARWYTDRDADKIAYQVIKYRQRDGWTHRDVIRKAHPVSESHNQLFHWITQGEMKDGLPDLIHAFEQVQKMDNQNQVAQMVSDYRLPREAIPTQFLNHLCVWEAMLKDMPMTAMIRNLGKMTVIGLLEPMSTNTQSVVAKLTDQDLLQKARIHPLAILVALKTYQSGRGVKGSLSWNPVREIVDALDHAFYLSFGNVEPTGKRTMLALDVSGSMGCGEIAGMTGITPRIGSAAMALVTANVEKNYLTMGFSDKLVPLSISPRQRLDDVIRTISNLPFGGTDCALPMVYALENQLKVETFIVYTDSETWYGSIHPSQALQEYRQKMGIPAKLVVVGMVSNQFSIADPNDAGMMDVVGFDTAAPNVIADFVQ